MPAIRFPEFADFSAAAAQAEFVVACVALDFDHETAVSLADRFVGEPYLLLLESAASGPNARYSFVGMDPQWRYEWRLGDESAVVSFADGTKRSQPLQDGNPIFGLRQLMGNARLKTVHPAGFRHGGPDVAAMLGPVGFFGYDCAHALEPTIGTPLPKKLGLPDALWFLPRTFLVLDHLARRLFVSRLAAIDEEIREDPKKLRASYDATIEALETMVRSLRAVHSPPPLELVDAPADFKAANASFTEEEFAAAGKRCLEEIRAGEIFQIQVGNRLSLPSKARPFDVFRHLRILNPSPYMFFFKFGEEHLLGASPEMMVGVQGRSVTHRPIAGTRRRVWNTEKDQKMRAELVNSEKERAEHVMLVDLGRNDIGRVAAAGSVRVEELMVVEEYSHVFHMVSQVTGSLAAENDAFDALAAGFPNGTVTGAPKIRAMQLIRTLESISREFYAGSLGLFDFFGNLRSTLVIRTIHMARGVASTQASAGFVYDSIVEQEWLETRNKMAACMTAMQNTR